MSDKDRHQRRRRELNMVLIFKVITALGQAVFYLARLWFWMTDRQ